MPITFDRKLAAKHPVHHGHDTGRKHAYAEQRLIAATDRYIAAQTTPGKQKARKWMDAWRSFRTGRR